MDILQIYKKAWEIVKNNKVLWVFGMILVVFAGGGANFSSGSNFSKLGDFTKSTNGSTKEIFDQFPNQVNFVPLGNYFKDLFLSVPTGLYIALGFGVLVAVILGLIISLVVGSWAKAAAIGAINLAFDGKPVTLREGSQYGINNFKRIIWLSLVPWLLYSLGVFFIGGILAGFVVLLSRSFLIFLPIVFLSLALVAAVLVMLAISATLIWAERVAVIEGKEAKAAFWEGWRLVKKYFGEMLLLGLGNCFLNCCLGSLIAGVIVLLIGIAIGIFAINKGLGWLFIMVIILIVLPIILLSVLISGIYKIFNWTTWNILYRQVREKDKNGQ